MKVRIRSITELRFPRPMWQDHPGAIPRPMPEAPLVAPRFLVEVETLGEVGPEELARVEVGMADWADLVFPGRRRADVVVPECSTPLDVRCVCHAHRDQLLDAVGEFRGRLAEMECNWKDAAAYNGRMDDLVMQANQDRRAALAMLRELEWKGTSATTGLEECPMCGAAREVESHALDCKLAAALKKAP